MVSVRANFHLSINEAYWAQFDIENERAEKKIPSFIKNLKQCHKCFESGRFSYHTTATGKDIDRQIVTSKLVHAIELINWHVQINL